MSDFGSNQRERQSSALVGGCFIWVIWSLRGGASSETDPCTRGWSASWKGFKFSILLLEGTPMAALILFNKSLRMSNEDEKIMYSKMLIWSGFKAMYLFIKWLRWRQKSEFVDGYAWIHVIEDVRLCLNLWMILFAVLFILWEKKKTMLLRQKRCWASVLSTKSESYVLKRLLMQLASKNTSCYIRKDAFEMSLIPLVYLNNLFWKVWLSTFLSKGLPSPGVLNKLPWLEIWRTCKCQWHKYNSINFHLCTQCRFYVDNHDNVWQQFQGRYHQCCFCWW